MKILGNLNLRELHVACVNGHSFAVSIVGLGPTTDIVCPKCECAFRFPRSEIRRKRKTWDKLAKMPGLDRVEVRTIRAELETASPLPKATVLAQ